MRLLFLVNRRAKSRGRSRAAARRRAAALSRRFFRRCDASRASISGLRPASKAASFKCGRSLSKTNGPIAGLRALLENLPACPPPAFRPGRSGFKPSGKIARPSGKTASLTAARRICPPFNGRSEYSTARPAVVARSEAPSLWRRRSPATRFGRAGRVSIEQGQHQRPV